MADRKRQLKNSPAEAFEKTVEREGKKNKKIIIPVFITLVIIAIIWRIVDYQGNTVYTGGPYTNVTGGQANTESVCVAPGCYDFFIND